MIDFFPASGGTEILKNGLYANTNISNYDINLMLSTPKPVNIKYNKINILWQHLNHNDESLHPLNDQMFLRSMQAFIYVSNWQYEKFRYIYNIPTEKSYVIKNAINPIEFISKPKNDKIKLIYTSTPYRGLDVLLDAFELLNRDDIELDVYSSTIIYGSGYAKHVGDVYDSLFDRAKNMKNVNYFGYITNQEIHKALQSAHIFSYPSTFEETCCLAMVEAAAAGCKIVTTNLGAIYETGSEYATMLPMKNNRSLLVKEYAKVLNNEINNYWNISNQEKLKEQSDFYNKYYSWDLRSKEWNNLFDKLSSI